MTDFHSDADDESSVAVVKAHVSADGGYDPADLPYSGWCLLSEEANCAIRAATA